MKSLYRSIGLFCLIAFVVCSTASAETANEDLPSLEQVLTFVDSVSDQNIGSISEASLESNPTWKWDTWKDTEGNEYISFYYVSDSSKGYGSVYFDNSGKKTVIPCGDYDLVRSYLGEEVAEENVTEDIVETNDSLVSDEKEVETVSAEEVIEENIDENISEEKHRIIQKIATLLTKFNNDKIDIGELKEGIDNILED